MELRRDHVAALDQVAASQLGGLPWFTLGVELWSHHPRPTRVLDVEPTPSGERPLTGQWRRAKLHLTNICLLQRGEGK